MAAIGRRRHQVETPALIVDLALARSNITAMGERIAQMPAGLRPHIKVHKSPELARLQIAAGALGVSAATAWEAVVMAEAGIPNILVANQVVGPGKIRALAQAARLTRITAAVDSHANLGELSAAATAAGTTLGVIAEVDIGMGRCGVRSPGEALELARHAHGLPGIEWLGVMGYEGHCMLEPDPGMRGEKQRRALSELIAVVDHLEAGGVACEVVSAGGTGTYDLTGANARVTELQAGSYVFMDTFHRGLIPGFEMALTVLSTVRSRHGDRVILDAGRKAVSVELGLPEVVGHRAKTVSVSEEHAGVDVAGDCTLAVGDTVELVPGYAPTTTNLHAIYHVVEDGVVTDVWPVLARYGSDTATVGG